MKVLGFSLAFAALAVASPVPEPAPAGSPSSFKVGKIAYGGSGCPQGTLDVGISSDGKILPILYGKDFSAFVGPGSDPTDSRKNCQINVALQYSPGFQYSVVSTDYSGWADLDSGIKGTVKSTYYFSGEQKQTSVSATIAGPVTGQFTKHDDVGVAVWSPCGGSGNLNINTEAALTPISTSSVGLLTVDKQTTRFTHSIYLRWQEC